MDTEDRRLRLDYGNGKWHLDVTEDGEEWRDVVKGEFGPVLAVARAFLAIGYWPDSKSVTVPEGK